MQKYDSERRHTGLQRFLEGSNEIIISGTRVLEEWRGGKDEGGRPIN
jgi:hypothetical protein